MAHTKWISGISLLSFCAAAQLAWAKSPQITSVVFSPENKTLWMETTDGADTAVMYLSAQEAKLVQGKMSKDAPAPSDMPPGAIFEAWDAAQQVLKESQNTHPIAEQQALCDATIKLIAGDMGLQILRATKFAMASQSAPSTTLLATIQKGPTGALPSNDAVAIGGNGGNEDRPAPTSAAIGGNGGNEDHPTLSLKRVAIGGNGGNEDRPAPASAAIGGNGGNEDRPTLSLKRIAIGGNGGNEDHPIAAKAVGRNNVHQGVKAIVKPGGPVKSLPSRNF